MGTGIRAGRTPRFLMLAGLVALVGSLSAAAAPAQAANWGCRGRGGPSGTAGNRASAPVVANSGFSPWVDSSTGPSSLGPPAGQPSAVQTGTGSAQTSIDPDAAPAAAQTVGAVGD